MVSSVDEELAIVMEGLKESRPVADICREHKISQTLYYKWRDKFLEAGKNNRANVKAVSCNDYVSIPFGHKKCLDWRGAVQFILLKG